MNSQITQIQKLGKTQGKKKGKTLKLNQVKETQNNVPSYKDKEMKEAELPHHFHWRASETYGSSIPNEENNDTQIRLGTTRKPLKSKK